MESKIKTSCNPDLLSAAVDGCLTSEEQTVLDAHLEDCSSCRELSRSYQSISASVRNLPEVMIPCESLEEIIAQTERVPQSDHFTGKQKETGRLEEMVRVFRAFYSVLASPYMAGALAVALAAFLVSQSANLQAKPKRACLAIYVSSADPEEVSGIDLAVEMPEGILFDEKAAPEWRNFLCASGAHHRSFRVSMASSDAVRIDGKQMLLNIPIQAKDIQNMKPVIKTVRAYRPDGSLAKVQISSATLPESQGGDNPGTVACMVPSADGAQWAMTIGCHTDPSV